MNFVVLTIFSLLTIIITPFSLAQSHPANQINGGNFSNNDFEFPLNLFVNQSLTVKNGNLDLNNNAILNIDWSTSDDGPTSGLDADTVDGNEYNSNWPTTLSNIQSATTNDFHNIGGTDDDVPESGDFGAAADLDASGQVADDSHNHIYSNIDATTSANWATIVSDETGTGNMVFSSSPTLTTPRIAELRAASSAGLKLFEDGGTKGIFINDSGAVGIGTTDPQADFHVDGRSFVFSDDVVLPTLKLSYTTGYGNIEMKPGAYTVGGYIKMDSDGYLEMDGGDNQRYKISGSSDSYIDTTYDFGVGTETPAAKLDVVGNISATSHVSGKQPAFRVLNSASTAAAGAYIVWNAERFDNYNAYSTSTGLFTAPIDGIYHFGFLLLTSKANSGEHRVFIQCSDSTQTARFNFYKSTTNSWETFNGDAIMELSAGDTVGIYYYSGGGTLWSDPDYNSFYGYYIGS